MYYGLNVSSRRVRRRRRRRLRPLFRRAARARVSSRLCETLVGDIDYATATADQKVVVGKLDSAVLSGIFASRDIAFVRPIDIMITWGPSAEHHPTARSHSAGPKR
mgnify:CR=1 FL=1